MLAFARRRRSRSQPELTPLIDVVFQLLVFFLLTSVFIDPAVPLKLPDADTAESQPDTPVMVSITAEGALYVDDQQVPPEALADAIREAVKDKQKRKVAVRGDGAARYARFMQVVDACRKVGVADVMLAAQSVPAAEETP